jgi:CBS domain-containing protein
MSWTVEKVMTRDVVAVRPGTAYKELVALMNDHAIGALPVVDVVDSQGRLVGLVSAEDLLAKERAGAERRLASRGRGEQAKAQAETAEQLMTSPVVSIAPDDSLVRAARLMHRAKIRHLPVVDDDGRLVGIVSRGDLLKPYLRSDESIRHEIATDVLGHLTAASEPVEAVVVEGVVTLTGRLETSADADLVARLVSAIDGVVALRNHLAFRVDTTEPGAPPRPAAGWRAR